MVAALDSEGKDLSEIVQKHFDFRPQAIIERLGLRQPIFRQTATYGHFGKVGLPWEEVINIS
jgi:S-adenosylmethionine synthetase